MVLATGLIADASALATADAEADGASADAAAEAGGSALLAARSGSAEDAQATSKDTHR